jgi:hypothetical protein
MDISRKRKGIARINSPSAVVVSAVGPVANMSVISTSASSGVGLVGWAALAGSGWPKKPLILSINLLSILSLCCLSVIFWSGNGLGGVTKEGMDQYIFSTPEERFLPWGFCPRSRLVNHGSSTEASPPRGSSSSAGVYWT